MDARLTPAALADLEDIDDYVTENFGPERAIETRRNLFETFEELAVHPRMGRAIPSVAAKPVRFFHLKPYWIVYQPATPLLIHRIYHASRDLNRLSLK
jgi:plasmid stabilization system protein ParE